MRRLIVVFVFLLLGLLVGNRPIQAQGGSPAEVLRYVNQVRARNGLPPYTWNGQLAAAAQNQSNYMAEFNVYVHSGYGGSTPVSRAQAQGYYGYVSENVVGGGSLSPRAGVLWWENSPVHYRGMTSTLYTEAGVGVAFGHNQTFYTLVMGTQTGSAPPRNSVADDQPAPLRITPITLAEPREDGSIVHTLQPGQALWTLSAYYDVDLDFLLQINNLDENDFILDGQEILVKPSADWVPPPTPTPPFNHIVNEGETLWYIAYLYDLEMDDLLYFNSVTLDDIIRPGTELKVRLQPGEAPPPTATPQLAHIVSSGDTLWSIALRYGLTLEELLALNGLTADALLQLGDEMLIRPNPTPAAEPLEVTPTPLTELAEITPIVELVEAESVAEVVQTPVPDQQQSIVTIQPTPTLALESADTGDNPTNVGYVILALAFVLLAGGALTLAVRGR